MTIELGGSTRNMNVQGIESHVDACPGSTDGTLNPLLKDEYGEEEKREISNGEEMD